MTLVKQAGRYLGGAISVGGLAFGAAFVGRRSADPLATNFVEPFTIWVKLGGILAGVVVIVVGLWVYGLFADADETSVETDD